MHKLTLLVDLIIYYNRHSGCIAVIVGNNVNMAAVSNNDNISHLVRTYINNILKAKLNYLQISEDVYWHVEFQTVRITRIETHTSVANTNGLYILQLNTYYFYLKQ